MTLKAVPRFGRLLLPPQVHWVQTWEMGLLSLVLKGSGWPLRFKGSGLPSRAKEEKQLPREGVGPPGRWIWKIRLPPHWAQRIKQEDYS